MIASDLGASPWIVGRYAVYDVIARGGMATVHLGRLLGSAGFGRTVAIKRLHPHLATDHEFSTMMLDEARIAGRVQHPNVVPLLDVVTVGEELLLVMDYVPGESLMALQNKTGAVPPALASAVVADMLHGLHAAHEATDERGAPLYIVHRDVSPQNVIVGTHGAARIFDFGVAKAAGRMTTTGDSGQLKGKLSYMAPEQLGGRAVDRRVDVYAAAVVLWETLTGVPLFRGDNAGATVENVLLGCMHPPSHLVPSLPEALDELVMRGLARDPAERFATAQEMALALERAMPRAPVIDVAGWVNGTCRDSLARRAEIVSRIEHEPRRSGALLGTSTTSVEATDSVGTLVAPMQPFTSPGARSWRRSLRSLAIVAAVAAGALAWTSAHRSAPRQAAGGAGEPVAPAAAAPPGALAVAVESSAPSDAVAVAVTTPGVTTDAMVVPPPAAVVPPAAPAAAAAASRGGKPGRFHVRPPASAAASAQTAPPLFNRD
jgi:serine/threonine-protein kinase